MKEYIERSAAIAALENTNWYSINHKGKVVLGASEGDTALFKASDMFALLRIAPAADVAPVVHGEWIVQTRSLGYFEPQDTYICSICGREEFRKEPYCNCGARMDGGNSNE